jgi:hypothetical protein
MPTVVKRMCGIELLPRLDADLMIARSVPRAAWPYSEVGEVDPVEALRSLVRDDPFYNGFSPPEPNFADPRWLARVDALARERGAKRTEAVGRIETELLRAGIPIVPFMNPYDRVLLSPRVRCFRYETAYWVDLGALCPR